MARLATVVYTKNKLRAWAYLHTRHDERDKMRKPLWIIPVLLLFAAIGNAHADSFTYGAITFTVSSGGPTPTASFVIDDGTGQFTNFSVTWNGEVYDFAVGLVPPPPVFITGPFPVVGTWSGVGPDGGTCLGGEYVRYQFRTCRSVLRDARLKHRCAPRRSETFLTHSRITHA